MEQVDERCPGLELRLDEDAKVLLATVAPVPGMPQIDAERLRGHLDDTGHGALRLKGAAFDLLMQQYNAGKPVAALPIAECVDASLTVRISADGLAATLGIVPPQGGAEISKEDVLAELAAKGITEGIALEAINRAIGEGVADEVEIARGQPPVAGEDGWLESLLPEVRDRRPQLDASGLIDYRDLGEIQVVRPGDALMRRHPPTAGTPGVTVCGVAIPPRPGKDVAFAPQLAGAALSADDPDCLVATVAGQPVQVRGGMMVEPVFSVDVVNVASGNVRFDGSVKIRGDVAAGMVVRTSGDIEVGGVVESATLDAGGSIVVKGGVIGKLGRKDAGEHIIRCGGSFSAAYAQQVRVEAGDSIFIDDIAMQCELAAANHIRVGQRRRGQVIGGRLTATLSICAKVLGSPNRIETRFEVGTPPELHKRQIELAKQRDARETQLLDISKLLAFADQNPGRLPADKLDKARQTAAALSASIAELRAEEEALARRVELAQGARVVAERAMYEGVVVTLGNQRFRVVGEHGGGTIGLGSHGVELLKDVPPCG